MAQAKLKLTIAGIVFLGAVAYLAFAGVRSGWASYHLPVDSFVGKTEFRDQRVRLAGRARAEGMQLDRAKLQAQFTLAGETQTVPVNYHGAVPDMLKGDCEVVVEGRLDKQGIFQADVLMTKCASKYESDAHKAHKPKAAETAEKAL